MKLPDLELLVQQMREHATDNGRHDPLVDFWIQTSELQKSTYITDLQIEEGVGLELDSHTKYAKQWEGDYSIPLKIVG